MAAAKGETSMATTNNISLPTIQKAEDHSFPVRQATFVDVTKDGVSMGLPRLPAQAKRRTAVLTSRSVTEEADDRGGLKQSWLVIHDIVNPFNYTVDELLDLVDKKISSGFEGLHQTFMNTSKNGLISREQLHQILLAVCGYISNDLFNRFMQRIQLQHIQLISFEMFISRFSHNKEVQKCWYQPKLAQKKRAEEPRNLERHLTHPNIIFRSSMAPASHAIMFLRELVKHGEFKPQFHLPPSVLSDKEKLLKPYLRRIVTLLSGYNISDKEMDKLWDKFDLNGEGAISRDQFYELIGYKASPEKESKAGDMKGETKQKNSELRNSAPVVKTPQRKLDEDAAQLKRSLPSIRQNQPAPIGGFTSILEEIIYQFELPVFNILTAFQKFDPVGDNFIPKKDFRTVLRVFGFPIGALDLETFVSSNHLLQLNDLLEYKDFIARFTLREDYGIVSRILHNPKHVYNKDPGNRMVRSGSGTDGWSPAELEAGLVEYFMGRYLRFLSSLRQADAKKTGFVPRSIVQPIIEDILCRTIADDEWSKLLTKVGYNDDEEPYYENIISLINKRRPVWNVREKLGHRIRVIDKPPQSKELETLEETVKQELEDMKPNITPFDFERSLNEISNSIRELMRTRFRKLDYAYRSHDRKQTGRLDRDMLQNILKDCGLELSCKEMEKLWCTFALARDGLYTWSKFCTRYINDDVLLKQACESETPRTEEDLLTSADELPPLPTTAQKKGRPSYSRMLSRQSDYITQSQQPFSDPVLSKIQAQVIRNMSTLEELFKGLDPKNRGYIDRPDAEESFIALKFQMSVEELQHLVKLFDLEECGKFHYRTFLHSMTPRQVASRMSQKISTPRPSSRLLKNRIVLQLKGRGPELSRQFKKSDPLGQGYLSFRDFKSCLDLLGVKLPVADDSFSEIASIMDNKLQGQINYEEFTALCSANS